MTFEMVMVFGILGASVILLVTEWVPMEVVALLLHPVQLAGQSGRGGLGRSVN